MKKLNAKQRSVLEKAKSQPFFWGFNAEGGKEYFFEDGSKVNAATAQALLRRGVLAIEQTPLGDGQRILPA